MWKISVKVPFHSHFLFGNLHGPMYPVKSNAYPYSIIHEHTHSFTRNHPWTTSGIIHEHTPKRTLYIQLFYINKKAATQMEISHLIFHNLHVIYSKWSNQRNDLMIRWTILYCVQFSFSCRRPLWTRGTWHLFLCKLKKIDTSNKVSHKPPGASVTYKLNDY